MVCKVLQHLKVLFSLAKAQVALLRVLNICAEFIAQRWPYMAYAPHRKRELARVPS